MRLFFSLIIAVACALIITLAQRINRRQAQQCITPDNYYGHCTPLSYCPQVVNIFQTTNQRIAQEFLFALQRACGTRNVNGDPVVCCKRPYATIRPVTHSPNPFLPTQPQTTVRNTRVPQILNRSTNTNPFLTTQRTVMVTRAATTRPVPTTIRTTTISSQIIDNRARECRAPDARSGACVDLKSCTELLNELYAKPRDEAYANYLRASNAICGGISSIVCCPLRTQGQITTQIPIISTNDTPRRLPTVQEGCGHTSNSFKKIVGGEVSKKGAWPWIALLGYDDGLSGSPFKCGGTLVTARHVITAAHCIRKDLTFVRLGEHDLTTDSEARHVDIRVVRKEGHNNYNRRNGRNDIGILYLERNVQFNDLISPICLPTTNELRSKSFVGHTPFVAGWGRTMEGGASANILQQLQIPIYENSVCINSYRKQNRLISNDQFDTGVICAGVLTGGKDTCQGDSGGPLMIPVPYQNDVRYYLIGVVSYGIGCARPNVPGVYSSTQYFIDWIAQKVANTS